ncbi:hypothetical protein PTTG_05762, partial [Puccinia triticina 1-1 BBBD Race 1]
MLHSLFSTVAEISNFAIRIEEKLNRAGVGMPTPNPTAPDPNTMDLLAFHGRLSDSEKARMMQEGLCFRCGTQGHISCKLPTKKGKGRGNIRIAAMEDQIQQLVEGMVALGGGGVADKGGKAKPTCQKMEVLRN